MASEDPSDSKSRLSEMIEAEDAALDRVTEFIREGMRAGRISDKSGELLIDTAEINHHVTVQRLRKDAGPSRGK